MKLFKQLPIWLLIAAILAPVLLSGTEVEIANVNVFTKILKNNASLKISL